MKDSKSKYSRRRFLRDSALSASALALGGFGSKRFNSTFPTPYLKNPRFASKVIVLGMDGLDPDLVQRFVAEGELPTFKSLMAKGHFGELQTTMPPQSPVAWSSFITGTNPGGHGIFDFIHRDPKSFSPYMSTSRSSDAKHALELGNWNIPLGSGKVELMRKGQAFWKLLEERSIPASIYAIPANFPVVEGSSKTISGMGTPDLLGTYGTFTFFSEAEVPNADKFVGGRVVRIQARDHKFVSKLPGPKNSFKVSDQNSEVELIFNRDPWEKVVRIAFDGQEIIMREGEWSEWMPLRFELLPLFATVGGMVRFYVQSVHPKLKIYVSPINIDPMEPGLPICTPDGYSRELAQAVGRYYTQGFPADTKSLSNGIFSDDEYLAQAKYVLDESFKIFDYQFKNFDEGFFFFYFSSTDQNQHMLLRTMFPEHPLYDPAASPEVKDAVRYFYRKMDDVLKMTLAKVDSNTMLLAISDHGFAPFSREVHLSSWLVENGYTVLTDPSKRGEGEFYQYVDWERTRAYALGLNGIYVNLKGREKFGSVDLDKADGIKRELALKLAPLRDPIGDKPVFTNIYSPTDIYSGPFVSSAPDLLVGYQSGYRISDEAVLGKFPKGIVGNRTDKWSSDHCSDPQVVPGMLLANRECTHPKPGLWDMAPSILNAFGIETPPHMNGRIAL